MAKEDVCGQSLEDCGLSVVRHGPGRSWPFAAISCVEICAYPIAALRLRSQSNSGRSPHEKAKGGKRPGD